MYASGDFGCMPMSSWCCGRSVCKAAYAGSHRESGEHDENAEMSIRRFDGYRSCFHNDKITTEGLEKLG